MLHFDDDFTQVHEELIRKARWHTTKLVVIKRLTDGIHWGLRVHEPNTECQEVDPFDLNPDGLVELTQYEPYEKTVIAYREI